MAAGICLLLALHLVTSFWPSVWTCGIDYWSEFPVWARFVALGVGCLALYPAFGSVFASWIERRRWSKSLNWVTLGVLFVAFLVFRSRGLSYGDGYSFRGYFTGEAFPELISNLRLFVGDLAVHWAVIRVGGMPTDIAYAILSAFAGVLSLWAIVRIAKGLFPADRSSRFFVVASGCSSAMVALWFGYVEAYSLVGAAILWSLAFALDGSPTRRSLALAWLCWLAAVLLHLVALVLLPALVAMTFLRSTVARLSSGPRALLWLVAGFVAWGAIAMVGQTVAPGIFVPFIANEQSNYTAFSFAHLLDTFNLALFVAPIGLLALAVIAIGGPRKQDQGASPAPATMLGLAAASLWYFSFWIDPLLGAFRDWDLLGVYGIPMSLWGGCELAQRLPRSCQWIRVGAFAALHAIAFVGTLQDETQAMLRVDRMVREDLHYQREFHRGERLPAWAHVQVHSLRRYDLAADHLGKRAMWEPGDVSALRNLGSVYWFQELFDSAAYYFEAALAADSLDPNVLNQLGITYARQGNWEAIKHTYERLSKVRSLSTEELNRLAFADIELTDYPAADTLLALSVMREPVQDEAYYYHGWLAELRADTNTAIAEYERALAQGTEVDDVYLSCVQLYQARGQWDESTRIASLWALEHPNSASAHFFLGTGNYGRRAYEAANRAFRRTLELDPTSALATYYAAATFRHLGDPDRAKMLAQRAASLDSSMALPYLELVYLAADAGDREGAMAATKEYLRRAPRDSAMAYLRQFMEPEGRP